MEQYEVRRFVWIECGLVDAYKSTIYQKIAEGTFPKPHKLGARSVAWLESEILAWLDEQNQSEVA